MPLADSLCEPASDRHAHTVHSTVAAIRSAGTRASQSVVSQHCPVALNTDQEAVQS
jgi:hypothetical protein